jgi:hypothetical protein
MKIFQLGVDFELVIQSTPHSIIYLGSISDPRQRGISISLLFEISFSFSVLLA